MPPHVRTVCLEFFGPAREAVPSIVEIKRYLDQSPGGAILAGLEHLDERYLRAVGYATKSRRGGLPKMVLLGDIVGDDDAAVARAASEVVRIANARSGEGFTGGQCRSAQDVLARPAAHGGDRPPHQRLQAERGRGHPAAAPEAHVLRRPTRLWRARKHTFHLCERTPQMPARAGEARAQEEESKALESGSTSVRTCASGAVVPSARTPLKSVAP